MVIGVPEGEAHVSFDEIQFPFISSVTIVCLAKKVFVLPLEYDLD